MNLQTFLIPILAAAAFAAPATSLADHKHKDHHDHHGDWHHGSNYYYSRPSYGYYGYRPYYGYGYPRTTFGLSIYSRPTYYTSSVYRGYEYSDSLAADVQRALKRRGYYHGYIDGDIGAGSRAAIRAYQRDHRLAVTGRIDSALLRSLNVG
jgi:hypothetical protein